MGLLVRAARLIVRLAGWLVTPVAAALAAAIGASAAAMAAPRFSPTTGVAITAGGGLLGAIVGLALWVRLLRGSPQLREALAMTEDGAPQPEVVEELMTGEVRNPTDPPE